VRTQAPRHLGFAASTRTAGVVGLSLLLVGIGPGAGAAPTSDIAAVQVQVAKLHHEAEIASETYNDTRERLKSLGVRVGAAQTRLNAQRDRVQVARRLLGQVAAESYRQGDFGTLELYLGDTPEALLAQAGVVRTLADRQSDAILRLDRSQRDLTTTIADLGRQKVEAAAAESDLAAARRAVETKLDKAQALLSRLTADQRRELERAAADADRRAAGNDDPGGATSPPAPGDGGSTTCSDLKVSAPTARVRAVLDYACAQIGDPYQWGADGPDSFDCSGLTMQAWARGGISLPHSSRMQVTYGTRVSVNDIRPGDLVFFYSPISHVAIYLGNGMMVTAPQTGDSVRVKPVNYSNLVAAVRL
jgi:peptidoglycan DL-endopeptidase CwlO